MVRQMGQMVSLLVFFAMAVSVAEAGQAEAKSGTKPAADSKTTAKVASTKVTTAVHVRLSEKSIRYFVDGDSDRDSPLDGAILAAGGPVKVAYYRLNPLEVQATASASAVDDPSATAVTQLIQAIAGLPGIIAPASPATVTAKARLLEQGGVCPSYVEARTTLTDLQRLLFSSKVSSDGLQKAFTGWQQAIRKELRPGNGVVAIEKGIAAIDEWRGELADDLTLVDAAIEKAQKGSAGSPLTTERRRFNEVRESVDLQTKNAANDADRETIRKAFAARLAALEGQADTADDCAAETATVYGLILLSGPGVRLAEMRKLDKAVKSLAEALKTTYAKEERWLSDGSFVLASDITPTRETRQRVSVKVQTVGIDASDAQLSLTSKDAASASFDVQQYARFVPEIGVGATFGFITRPKYGTSKDDKGQTIVARAEDEEVSIDPTVMVNFVPRGMAGAVPMIQLGASTSKSSPAVFIGGGWRVPGSGDGGIGVGLGLMMAWVKDLQTLTEGSVVSGTSDLEADLAFDGRPKPAVYFNIQYKF